jgi:cell shape-determining protein MreD
MLTRACAAVAAIVTALLLQLTLVGPVLTSIPASLPAVLVAAVAICAGPGAGLSMGFSVGILADLGSPHPVGVLALVWLGLGLAVGRYADPRRSWASEAAVAVGFTAIAAVIGEAAIALTTDAHLAVAPLLGHAVGAGAADLVLFVVVLPLTRSVLGRVGPPRLGIQRG